MIIKFLVLTKKGSGTLKDWGQYILASGIGGICSSRLLAQKTGHANAVNNKQRKGAEKAQCTTTKRKRADVRQRNVHFPRIQTPQILRVKKEVKKNRKKKKNNLFQ
jgi:hypothetical protein